MKEIDRELDKRAKEFPNDSVEFLSYQKGRAWESSIEGNIAHVWISGQENAGFALEKVGNKWKIDRMGNF